MRVLLVDDHPVVLSGLATLLNSDPDIAVVGTALTAAEADTIDITPGPDVAVVDLRLPDGDGVDPRRATAHPVAPHPSPDPDHARR